VFFPSVSEVANLNQNDRRRLLHLVMAFSIRPQFKRKRKRKGSNRVEEVVESPAVEVIERRTYFSYTLLGVPICIDALCSICFPRDDQRNLKNARVSVYARSTGLGKLQKIPR
jgi:hypothetical protein